MTTTNRTRYTLRSLLTLLARLAKPAMDAAAAEFGSTRSSTPAVVAQPPARGDHFSATPTNNPGRKVVGLVAGEPAPHGATAPEAATALAIPALPVPTPALLAEPSTTPIGRKPARKPSTRKSASAPARDATGTHGTLNWLACQEKGTGVVAIAAGRSTCRYAVAETPTDWDGRAFRLEKLDAGSDPESRAYAVFVCSRGDGHRCDCKGFETGNGRPCRHLNAMKALAAAGRV